MKIKIVLTVLITLLISNVCLAAITGVSGTLLDGETIIITGSDFGTKTTAAPISWTGVEIDAGTTGNDAVLTGFSQVEVSEVNAKFSNVQSHTGNSVLFDYDRTNNWSQFMLDMGSGQTVVFISMWVRIEYADTCETYQWKAWRLRSDTDYLHSNGITILNDWWYNEADPHWFNSGNVGVYYNNGTNGGQIGATADQMLWDEWQRVEAYYVASTPSTADGVTWLRRVGRTGDMLTSTALTTRDADDPLWRYIRFGQAYSNPTTCGAETGGLKVYLDDIYVDNTQARVEIGNSSNWADCTHREIQIPSAWADGEITVTVNQGSFADSTTAYLFVIDSAGAVSGGEEIVVGAPDETAPAISGVVINSTGLMTITFSETVVTTGYDSGDFVATGSITGAVNITSLTGSGSTRTFQTAFQTGETVTLAGTLAAGDIQDSSGNDMVTFADQAVTNNADTTAPTITQVITSVDGNYVYVTLSDATLFNTGFTISGDNSLTFVDRTGNTIRYSTATAIANGAVVTWDYTPGNVTDLSGNALAADTGTVTNNVPNPEAVQGLRIVGGRLVR